MDGARLGGAWRRRPSLRSILTLALAGLMWTVVVAVIAAYLGPVVRPPHVLLIAHRGDVTMWPENSLESIEAARDSAADGVEFDVRRSADGTWWVFHDAVLDDHTPGAGAFEAATDEQIQALTLDAGMGYDPSLNEGLVRIPTLTSVLDGLSGYDGIIVVDCKDVDPGAARELVEILAERVTIGALIALTPEVAAEMKWAAPDTPVLALWRDTPSPNIDIWLARADTADIGGAVLADAFGDVWAFVNEAPWPTDEIPSLDRARRFGAVAAISGDIPAALEWRATLER